METSSLPFGTDEYHFNYEEGVNSFCLHTRYFKGFFWDSCQFIQKVDGTEAIDYDVVKVLDFKITNEKQEERITEDTLFKIEKILKNKQFIKTLHVTNWSWTKERESIFDMKDFQVLVDFLNELDLTDDYVKLEVVNKENYISEYYGFENGLLHFLENKNRFIESLKKINFNNYLKVDFFHYVNSDYFSCWIPLKGKKALTQETIFYNPTTKEIIKPDV